MLHIYISGELKDTVSDDDIEGAWKTINDRPFNAIYGLQERSKENVLYYYYGSVD